MYVRVVLWDVKSTIYKLGANLSAQPAERGAADASRSTGARAMKLSRRLADASRTMWPHRSPEFTGSARARAMYNSGLSIWAAGVGGI